jgi:hypothetical protein
VDWTGGLGGLAVLRSWWSESEKTVGERGRLLTNRSDVSCRAHEIWLGIWDGLVYHAVPGLRPASACPQPFEVWDRCAASISRLFLSPPFHVALVPFTSLHSSLPFPWQSPDTLRARSRAPEEAKTRDAGTGLLLRGARGSLARLVCASPLDHPSPPVARAVHTLASFESMGYSSWVTGPKGRVRQDLGCLQTTGSEVAYPRVPGLARLASSLQYYSTTLEVSRVPRRGFFLG